MAKIHSTLRNTGVLQAAGLTLKTGPVTIAALATGILDASDDIAATIGSTVRAARDTMEGAEYLASTLPIRALQAKAEFLSEACGSYVSVASIWPKDRPMESWVKIYDEAAEKKWKKEHESEETSSNSSIIIQNS